MSDGEVDHDLAFSIAFARLENKEAPWYGTWNIVVMQKLFRRFCKPPCSTVTFPQLSLTHDVDTYEDDVDAHQDNESDSDSNDNTTHDLRFPRGDIGPCTPPRRQRHVTEFHPPQNVRCSPVMRDTSALSPEEYIGPLNLLLPLG
jgi:hypothetical protein